MKIMVNSISSKINHPTQLFGNTKSNKLVKNMEQGLKRIKNIAAPANAKRLKLNTPCAKTGQCIDCNSKERICNMISVIQKVSRGKQITVIIIGKSLGY